MTCHVRLDPELNRTGDVWHIMLPQLDPSLLYGAQTCLKPSTAGSRSFPTYCRHVCSFPRPWTGCMQGSAWAGGTRTRMWPCQQPGTAMMRCAVWTRHAHSFATPMHRICTSSSLSRSGQVKHCCHGSQGAVLLDPYATAILGRREFAKLGPVSTAMHVHCCRSPSAPASGHLDSSAGQTASS